MYINDEPPPGFEWITVEKRYVCSYCADGQTKHPGCTCYAFYGRELVKKTRENTTGTEEVVVPDGT